MEQGFNGAKVALAQKLECRLLPAAIQYCQICLRRLWRIWGQVYEHMCLRLRFLNSLGWDRICLRRRRLARWNSVGLGEVYECSLTPGSHRKTRREEGDPRNRQYTKKRQRRFGGFCEACECVGQKKAEDRSLEEEGEDRAQELF